MKYNAESRNPELHLTKRTKSGEDSVDQVFIYAWRWPPKATTTIYNGI